MLETSEAVGTMIKLSLHCSSGTGVRPRRGCSGLPSNPDAENRARTSISLARKQPSQSRSKHLPPAPCLASTHVLCQCRVMKHTRNCCHGGDSARLHL
jgi:hypothetical protein